MFLKFIHDSANIQFAPRQLLLALLYYLRPCRHEWFSEKISFTACTKSLKPWLAMAFTMFAQSVSLNFSRNPIPFMQYAG